MDVPKVSKVFCFFAVMLFTLNVSLVEIADACHEPPPPPGCDLKITVESECVEHKPDLIKYNICVTNEAGPTPVTVAVTDALPDGTSFIRATGDYCKYGDAVYWTIFSTDPDWVVTDTNKMKVCRRLVVRIDDTSDPYQTITNDVTVSDSGGCTDTCSETTTVADWQELCGGDGEEGCDECEGRITMLDLKYTGDGDNICVKVKDKKGHPVGSDFLGVSKNTEFTIMGAGDNQKLPSDIYIYTCDESCNTCKLNATFHTSCSRAIGTGLTSGDFEIVYGKSNEGGDLCPIEAGECDGKMTELTLKNTEAAGYFKITTGKGQELFTPDDGLVSLGGEIKLNGIGVDKNNTLGTEIRIYACNATGDDCSSLYAALHTSCSQPICVGMRTGSFEIVGGSSRGGGPLCECANVMEGDLSCK